MESRFALWRRDGHPIGLNRRHLPDAVDISLESCELYPGDRAEARSYDEKAALICAVESVNCAGKMRSPEMTRVV